MYNEKSYSSKLSSRQQKQTNILHYDRFVNRALKSRVFTLPVKELEAIFER